MRHPALAALALAAASCAHVPARFVDRPPVLAVADDSPIAMPRRRAYSGFSPDTISDAYLRHVLVDTLDPARTPEAVDINALDDVPRSSWFRPEPPRDAAPGSAPLPPFELDIAAAPDGWPSPHSERGDATVPVIDAQGRRYVLRRDSSEHPEMRTAAEVIAGRLVRAIGYLTPDVEIIDLTPGNFTTPDPARTFLEAGPPPRAGLFRVSATRWPIGIDLGPTPEAATRRDDPNDRLSHLDRRTLRALRVVAAWLRLTRLEPKRLRDVYVGRAPRGHVEHYIVGLHGALGADAVLALSDVPAIGPDREGTLRRLITLGLLPQPAPAPTQTKWSSLGEISGTVSVQDLSPSPSFVPFRRALPGDDYWVARRIAAIPHGVLAGAVAAGRLGDYTASDWLRQVLEARRAQVVAYAFDRVTPCEVDGLDGGALLLRDLAVAYGLATAASTLYLVEQLGASGDALVAPAWVHGTSERVRLELSPAALASGDSLVIRVWAARSGKGTAPRALEVHLRRGAPGPTWRVRGVRH